MRDLRLRREAAELRASASRMRRELVNRIDAAKAIAFFFERYGWSSEEVRVQVLTPLEESSLIGTQHADPRSIMCYQLPGSITTDGKPIVGGLDIDPMDFAFAAKLYPKGTSSVTQLGAGTSHTGANGGGRSKRLPQSAPDHPTTSGPVLCFAPGTDPAYIAAVIASLGKSDQSLVSANGVSIYSSAGMS